MQTTKNKCEVCNKKRAVAYYKKKSLCNNCYQDMRGKARKKNWRELREEAKNDLIELEGGVKNASKKR